MSMEDSVNVNSAGFLLQLDKAEGNVKRDLVEKFRGA